MQPTTTASSPGLTRLLRKPAILIGLGVLLLGILAIVLFGLILRQPYPTLQTVERQFVIEEDFTKVRKILVRTDATKEIVTMGGDSKFIAQHWNHVGAGLDSAELVKGLSWELKLEGTLEVRTTDAYIGEHDIDLHQDVNIDPDQIHSDVTLIEPTARLLQYEMTTVFSRQGNGRTVVRQRLKQEIVTEAPRFAHFIADRRVREAAEQALVNQERGIRKIIEENRDKRWLLLGMQSNGKPAVAHIEMVNCPVR